MSEHSPLIKRAEGVFTPNYRPAPIVLDRGQGSYVFDTEGGRYLDLVSGIAVSALGHNHPKLVDAIRTQAGRILHTSNLYLNGPAVELAEKLVAGCFADSVYFCNSGAEANEASIKLARRYAWDQGEKERVNIITFDRSFHGRTYGALTATAQPKYHEGFGPMPAGFHYTTYGDVAALEALVDQHTAAVMLEPIQGEGGVRLPPEGYLAEVRRICDAHGALLIFDEVQVGVGRTGVLFGHQHDGVTPDIMSLAKGIGGGLPLGAMVCRADVGASLIPGTHATTYGGNPVACAAGSVVLSEMTAPGALEHVQTVGAHLVKGLRAIGERFALFSEVRGRGLLIGAELKPGVVKDAKAIVNAAREHGVLAHIAGLQVLRLAPPLNLSLAEADEGLAGLSAAIEGLLAA